MDPNELIDKLIDQQRALMQDEMRGVRNQLSDLQKDIADLKAADAVHTTQLAAMKNCADCPGKSLTEKVDEIRGTHAKMTWGALSLLTSAVVYLAGKAWGWW